MAGHRERVLELLGRRPSASYDNPAFTRGSPWSSANRVIDEKDDDDVEEDKKDANLDEDSFRSDLERDSAHSSLEQRARLQQEQEQDQDEMPPPPAYHQPPHPTSIQRMDSKGRRMSHEQMYQELQRQSNLRASMELQKKFGASRYPILDTNQIQMRLQEHQEQQQQQQQEQEQPRQQQQPVAGRTRARPRSPPPAVPKRPNRMLPPDAIRLEKPEPRWYTLFGIVDPGKLRSICGGDIGDGDEQDLPYNPRYADRGHLDPIPEAEVPTAPPPESPGAAAAETGSRQSSRAELEKANHKRGTNDALFYGSIALFVAGILLLMSFASPYWLQSWDDTQSPLENMGLWEFCFDKFRHPDYQFDHLFNGCHALYGDEYRLIREKLLPGWLMVVQLFVTLALIASFVGQLVTVCLLLRWPLEWILRFEWHFCGFTLFCNASAAVLLFLSVCIFGAECWNRDWLLYPNFHYVSWSFAFAVFSCLGHIIGAIFMYIDCQQAKDRKERNKALIMQMHPPGFASTTSSYHMGGSGYI